VTTQKAFDNTHSQSSSEERIRTMDLHYSAQTMLRDIW